MYKLTIDGLYKSYGDNQVLKGVSLKARTGDVISLIGASKVSNQVPFLHQGRVEEEGSPEAVLGSPQSERLRQFLSGNLK